MHPANSVIFFTTATGAGYGLFVWLAVLALMGILPQEQAFSFTALLIGFGLIVGGLLSSTFHLGHPERAWRALSQWRSSWLSREGVMAILTFIPLSLFAVNWLFLKQTTGAVVLFAVLGAIMSLITVFTTSMIYASLKTIPAWHNVWTKAGYLVLCLMSGAILTMALCYGFGLTDQGYHLFLPAVSTLGLALIAKLLYWRHIHAGKPTSTAESATGLGNFGKVSLAGSPHGEDNYLLKEMGFKIARKHARKIRIIASIFAFALPLILIGIGMHMLGGMHRTAAIIVAALSCAIGLVFERWLFFAEAKHVVTLYYGESKV
ncbi:MAG: dimethyl sulfoxide reductase anchor subunit [Hyphomonadaceae bacterium]|nr:dimethyl sulfoxide reductase anchor subunit [Hyphomonadaceae bacterium]